MLLKTWTAQRSNQSILKEINREYLLEGLMLKMKLHFGHLMWRADSLEETLILGTIEGKRRRGQQKMRWLDNITDSMDMDLSKLWEIVEDGGAWRAAVLGVAKNRTWLSSRLNNSKEGCFWLFCYWFLVWLTVVENVIGIYFCWNIFRPAFCPAFC